MGGTLPLKTKESGSDDRIRAQERRKKAIATKGKPTTIKLFKDYVISVETNCFVLKKGKENLGYFGNITGLITQCARDRLGREGLSADSFEEGMKLYQKTMDEILRCVPDEIL